MSNLAHLFNRIVTDGKYESVLFIDDDSRLKHTDFFPLLGNLSFGKYTMYKINSYYWKTVPKFGITWIPFRKQHGILQVIMPRYGEKTVTPLGPLSCE